MTQLTSMCEMACQIIQMKQEEKRIEEEQAAKAQNLKIPVCYDDADDYDSAITPNEPVESLSMGDEHLNTIPATESDELIKSCVENLVPNPGESEGENGCDVPACFTTFSNILFNADYESDSSDYQSCSDDDFLEEIFLNPLFEKEIIPMKIDQHHFNAESDLMESMLNHDSSIIPSSSKINCHPENEIRLTERLLYDNSSPRPLEEFVSKNFDADIESFSPSPIPNQDSDTHMEEINLTFTPDDPMPPSIKDDDDDSERDIQIHEELLDNYSFSLLVHMPRRMITLTSNQEKSPNLLSHRGLENFQLSDKCPMTIHGKNIPILDVPLFYFYPLDQLKPSDTPVCYLCTCEQCGSIISYGTCLNCDSGNGNSFTYDPIPKSFDEVQISPNPPPQYHFNIYLCQICESNSHYGYECSQRVPLVYEPEPCYIQNFIDNDYSHDFPGVNPLIDYHCCYECGNSLNDFFVTNALTSFEETVPVLVTIAQHKKASKAKNLKIPICYDDDDDCDSAITPNEPVESLSMGDEHLNTIPVTESDELIKSCVENLVPNPGESEGENGCDVPACFITFSNILFNADYESDSSDYQSCSDEDFPKEIFLNPLFEEEIIPMKIDQHHFNAESDLIESILNHDSSIIPSSLKIYSLLGEFAGELTLLKSILPRIDKTDCHLENEIRLTERLLYDNSSPRPLEEFISKNFDADIESFSPSPIPNEDSDTHMEEIDLTFTPDDPMPSSIEDDDDSKRDTQIHEELLDNYSLSLPVPMPRLMITLALNQEKSLDLLSHRGLENFQLSAKCPMMIHGKNIPILDVPLFHFTPLINSSMGELGQAQRPKTSTS
nr:hypothetical protein [Tanacetum cinerariifolium]